MFKKFIYFSCASAMLLTTACSSDDVAPVAGQDALVSFTIELPAQVQSRAYGEATQPRTLHYQVFAKDGETLTALRQMTDEALPAAVVFSEGDLSKTIQLRLANSRDYAIVFWAAHDDAHYSFDHATGTVTIDYVQASKKPTANNDIYDAFFGRADVHVTGSITKTVELRRPFAQINIGATDATEAADAGWVTSKTSVHVDNVYSTLNLLTGEVSSPVTGGYTYTMAAKPAGDDATFPVTTTPVAEYQSMVYVLTGADQSLVNVDFTAQAGTEIVRNYVNVPIQRNYRTNIYGRILTEEANFTVEIKPAFDGERTSPERGVWYTEDGNIEISEYNGMVWLAKQVNAGNSFAGKTVTLISDIDFDWNPWTPIGDLQHEYHFAGVFEGNNHIISNLSCNRSECAGLFGEIKEGGIVRNLTIHNAQITGSHYAGAIVAYTTNSTSLIENCTIDGTRVSLTPNRVSGVYDNGDKAGGIVGYLQSGNVVKNCVVKNMTIKAFRDLGGIAGYANGTIEDCQVLDSEIVRSDQNAYTTSSDLTTVHEIVGRTAESVQLNNNTFTNVTVFNPTTLNETLAAGGDVTLESNASVYATHSTYSYGSNAVNALVVKGGTLDGGGNTLTVTKANGTWDCAIRFYEGTIKNLTIKGGFRGILIGNPTGEMNINNVDIRNSIYTISMDGGTNYDINITNSKLYGWTSYGWSTGNTSFVNMTNCEFGACSVQGYPAYAVLVPYRNTKLTNCRFIDGFEVDASQLASRGQTLTFKNCYVGTTLITADNITTLLGNDAYVAGTVLFEN